MRNLRLLSGAIPTGAFSIAVASQGASAVGGDANQ
jgi:hypothetical protein